MNFEKELEKLELNIANVTASYANQIIQKSKNQEQQCFINAKDDAEKFVNCMLPVMKRFTKHEAGLEFALAFTRFRTFECFERSGGEPLSMEECKVKATENIKKHYENFINKFSEAKTNMSTKDDRDDMTTPLRNHERHSSYTFNRQDSDFPVPNTLTPLEKLEIEYPENIGTYYLIASAIFMSLNALFVKFSSQLPVYELIFIRAIMTFGLSWVYISRFSPDLNIDDKKNKKFILYLSVLGFLVAVTYVYGVFTLDLSEAISVLFTTPMWIGLLSWFVLGQKLKQYELYCVGVIALGVLCIMRPDFDDSDDTQEVIQLNQSRLHGTLACIIHSFFNACTTLVVRIMNTKVHPLVIMLLSTVINFFISGINLIFSGWVTPDFGQWINLIIMTILFFGGQFFMMKGLQKADKTAYSPVILNYLQLPLAYLFDILIIGTLPLAWSLIGTALIIIGCITIVRIR